MRSFPWATSMVLDARPASEAAASRREPAVLVIDPNEEHQVLSTMALGRRGFRVTIAGTAREGIRLGLSQPFDVIVLDFKVRDMPALEVLNVFAERLPEVPKIFVVAVGQESTAVRALASGASGFLVKTARYNELLPSEVESQIRSAQARRRIREQKKALGASEERFQKAFRASPVAIAIANVADRRFVDANDAFLRIMGYAREEVVGRTEDELELHAEPRDHSDIVAAFERAGSLRDFETRFRTKRGDILTVSLSMETVEIEGEPCRLLLVRDVTTERRTERLRASLYKISEATNAAQDLPELYRQIHAIVGELMPAKNLYIALYDDKEDMLTFPYYVDEKDQPPAPYRAGRGLTEYVLRAGSPLLVSPEVFRDLVARGEVETVGTESVDWVGVPLTVAGRAIGVLAVQSYGTDVRYREEEKDILSFVSSQVAMAIDRKRSQETIRRAEARVRTMFQSAPVGIALVDLEGRITETNPAYQAMLGLGADEVRARYLRDVTHPDDQERSRSLFRELVEGSRGGYQMEERFIRRDGGAFWGRVTGSLIKGGGQEPSYVILMIEDVTEERKAQEDLAANERRFRAIMDKITDGIILTHADGVIVWLTASSERMTGFDSGELVGAPALQFIHPEDAERASAIFAELVAHPGGSVVVELRLRHKDGSWRWVEMVGTNLLDDPVLKALVFNFRDITERSEALERIRFQASVLSQVRNAVVVADSNGKIVYWNEYATAMFGWQPREVLGQAAGKLLRPTARAGETPSFDRELEEHGHWEGEITATRKDGSSFPAFATVNAMRNRLGELIGFAGVALDISDRLRAEAALKVHARQQAAVAELGSRALVEPQLSALMKEAVTVLARTLDVEGSDVVELLPDGGTLQVRAAVGCGDVPGRTFLGGPDTSLAGFTLQQGAPVTIDDVASESRFQLPAEYAERGILSSLSVIVPGTGKPFGVLGVHSRRKRVFTQDDVHFCEAIANVIANALERNRIEKVLADNERLASMGQLAAYVAHEVNTPLTNISLLASGIARRAKDPEILEKVEKIGVQRRRATDIITDLLNFPKQRTVKRSPEDLRKVIAAAVELVGPYRKPEVMLHVDTGDHAMFANVDPIQIRDVFVNLLRNALQATSSGSVSVRLMEWPDFLFVSVTDTGTGMSREVVEKLFNPLFSTKRPAEGMGLGLAMSRSIVTAHGGRIEVVSEVGKGSTFTVVLPRFETH